MIGSASCSRDRRYRYALTRRWADGDAAARGITWVMLNPSTAGATEDDPTLRRCIAFSRAWGFGALTVVNLFALRSPDPRALLSAADPAGSRSPRSLRIAIRDADAVVAAWGNLPGPLLSQARVVRAMLPPDALCLGLTAHGHPRHPLYVPGATAPVALTLAEAGQTMAA